MLMMLPPGFHHRADHPFGHVEYAFQVDLHHIIPLFGRHPHQQVVFRDTGIVYTDIDVAEFFQHIIHEIFAGNKIAGIALPGLRFYTHTLQFGGEVAGPPGTAVADIGKGDITAMLGEFQYNAFADTAGGPGYDGCFPSNNFIDPLFRLSK